MAKAKNIKSVEVMLDNGCKLMGVHQIEKFAGFKATLLWSVFYCEPADQPGHWNVFQPEYYPGNRTTFEMWASLDRRLKDPRHATQCGRSIEQLCEKEEL